MKKSSDQSFTVVPSSPEIAQQILQNLLAYNRTHIPDTQTSEPINLNYHIKNSAAEIIAGINTKFYWGVLFIDILWVNEKYRGQG